MGFYRKEAGVLVSVHSFAADPRRGVFILVFLIVMIGGALGLYAWRAPGMRSPAGFEILSREAFLLFNNLSDLSRRLVSSKPGSTNEGYDFRFIQLPLRHIVSDQVIRFADFLKDETENDIVDNAFQKCRLMLESVLGQVGKGLRIALTVLDFGRTTFGASCTGAAKTCLKAAVAHAKKRVQFKQTLAEFELVQKKLAFMAANAFAMEATTAECAGFIDRGSEDYMLETAMLKVWSTEALWQIVNDTPLPLLCFTREGLDATQFLAALRENQIAWMSEASIHGVPVVRACITSFKTTEADIHWVVEKMNRLFDQDIDQSKPSHDATVAAQSISG